MGYGPIALTTAPLCCVRKNVHQKNRKMVYNNILMDLDPDTSAATYIGYFSHSQEHIQDYKAEHMRTYNHVQCPKKSPCLRPVGAK